MSKAVLWLPEPPGSDLAPQELYTQQRALVLLRACQLRTGVISVSLGSRLARKLGQLLQPGAWATGTDTVYLSILGLKIKQDGMTVWTRP